MLISDKPKFAFQLTINDLTNVPQINGSCYIELQIKDGKRRTLHHHSSHPSKELDPSTTNNNKVNKSFLNKFDDTLSSLSLGKDPQKHALNSNKDQSTTSVSGSVSATTSQKKLHNFKCTFNYSLSCNLKFGLQKKKNLISNKYLLIKVYYVTGSDDHHHGANPIHSQKHTIEMGKVDINLSEYLNFDEPVTTKYLLSDSKVNSILSLTIGINELPSNMDFHTQLQIQDNNSSTASTNTTKTNLELNNGSKNKKNTFNVPQFEKKHVFNGINNVFGENGTFNGNPSQPNQAPKYKDHHHHVESSSSSKSSSDLQQPKEEHSFLQQLAPHHKGRVKKEQSPTTSSPQQKVADEQKRQQIMMDPIVSELYCKILECNWDPDLYPLLEYSPNQCIDDIFYNESNKYGCNVNLKEYYETKLKSKHLENEGEMNNYRELNGLINEYKYRPDLRSWNVSTEQH